MNYDRDIALTEPITRGMDAPFFVMPRTEDAELEIALVRQTKLMLAMRLHSLMYAACGGVAVGRTELRSQGHRLRGISRNIQH